MFKAVIFDFDGTLVDSEWAYALTDIEFVKSLGGDYFDLNHADNVGLGVESIIKGFMKNFSIKDKTVDELIELNDRLFLDIADDEIEVFPSMLSLIKELHAKGTPMAVATGTTEVILNKVSNNTGLINYISNFYSSRMVEHEKPQPDIFLHTATELGVKPEECLVLEDSQPGVIAAKRAGMNVIWLDNLNNKNRTLQSEVYRYYSNGHAGFDPKDVLELV